MKRNMLDFLTIIGAFAAFIIVVFASQKFKLLDMSGIVASFIIGLLVLTFGGWKWFAIVLVFFGLAMLFTKLRFGPRKRVALWNSEVRTWRNVFANGSLAAFFAVAESLTLFEVFTAGFLGAISTATADTLATEIGVLYPHDPRLITAPRRKVPAGTSGGVSPLGEIAILSSTSVIGLAAWVLELAGWSLSKVLLIVMISGLVGGTLDSLLGATVQGIYRCLVCGRPTDSSTHCGKASNYVRGIQAIDNDVVNFLSTLTGALVAILLVFIL